MRRQKRFGGKSWIGLGLVLAILGLHAGAWAKEAKLIPREILFGNPEKAYAQISPDGTRLAFLAPKEGVLNLWVMTIGKEDAKVVTQDKRRGISYYFWAEDNRHLVYMQDSDGDENWHLFFVDLTTGIIRDLTPYVGIRAYVIASDPNYPQEMLVALNLRDRRLSDAYRLNLESGQLDLDTENPGDVSYWVVDAKLQVRGSWSSTADGGAELRVRPSPKDPWKTLATWGPEDNFSYVVAFTPDGKGIYLGDSRKANTTQLVELDIATGKARVLAADPIYDINNTIIHPKTHVLQAVSFLKEREAWKALDPKIQSDLEAIRRISPGDFSLLNRDGADQKWVVYFTQDDRPTPYYIYNRKTRKSQYLFTTRPKLEGYTLAKMKPISLKARDGFVLHGYLTLPVGAPAKKLPMVLNVHGGPWGRDSWGYNPEAQWLANRGYACLQINFRGSTGYGKKFLNAGDREWGGKMHTDLVDAVAWAVKSGIADPKRIAIYGGSYGGYATLVGATVTPDLFACAVDAFGPSNLVTFLKTIPPYWETERKLFDKRVGNPETDAEFLKSRSPLFKVDQIKIPLLIAQGANDPRVVKAESDQMVEALQSKGKPVEYLVFPDEGHGFARPENRLKYYSAAEAFLGKYLGGRSEP